MFRASARHFRCYPESCQTLAPQYLTLSARKTDALRHANATKKPPRSGLSEIVMVLIKGGASSRLVILARADAHKTRGSFRPRSVALSSATLRPANASRASG